MSDMPATDWPIALALRGVSIAVAAEPALASARRHVAAYVMVVHANVQAARVARLLGVSKQAVTKANRHIEDRRDDPEFDAALDRLAARLQEPL